MLCYNKDEGYWITPSSNVELLDTFDEIIHRGSKEECEDVKNSHMYAAELSSLSWEDWYLFLSY